MPNPPTPPQDLPARHVVCVQFTDRMLAVLLTEGAMSRCMRGMPADAQLLGVNANFLSQCIDTLWAHPSFRPIPLGEEAPRLLAVFEVVENPKEEFEAAHMRLSVAGSFVVGPGEWLNLRDELGINAGRP